MLIIITITIYFTTGVCEKHIPFMGAFALQSCGRDCSPAWKLIFQFVCFSGGVFVPQTPVLLVVLLLLLWCVCLLACLAGSLSAELVSRFSVCLLAGLFSCLLCFVLVVGRSVGQSVSRPVGRCDRLPYRCLWNTHLDGAAVFNVRTQLPFCLTLVGMGGVRRWPQVGWVFISDTGIISITIGISAFRAPNQGLESSFCRRIVGRRLP